MPHPLVSIAFLYAAICFPNFIAGHCEFGFAQEPAFQVCRGCPCFINSAQACFDVYLLGEFAPVGLWHLLFEQNYRMTAICLTNFFEKINVFIIFNAKLISNEIQDHHHISPSGNCYRNE